MIAPAAAAARFIPEAAPPAPTTATLKVPAGALVPLAIDMDSSLVGISPQVSLPVRVERATEIALTDGQPDGRYRFEGGPWHSIKDGALFLRIDRVQVRLADDAPEIRMHGDLDLRGDE